MKTKLFAIANIISMSVVLSASAQPVEAGAFELSDKLISVSGIGLHRTVPCNGRKLEVAGSGHVVTATGECSHVDVSGADNTVDVAIAPKGMLEVSGSGHTVRWKGPVDTKRDISGADHKVTRVK